MQPLNWTTENEFSIGGIRFVCTQGDYSQKSDSEKFVLLKDQQILSKYFEEFCEQKIETVLEFGVFQGGSPALFTSWFDLKKFVGIDISAPVSALDEFADRPGIKDRIAIYYKTSQADAARIQRIVEKEFGGREIDLIVDDASHHYALSKKTFEIAFPLLKQGGSYVIEDWGWAHWPTSRLYRGETALSKLVFELVMLCGTRQDLISEVRIYPWFIVIKKGESAVFDTAFRIEDLIHRRGIELVGGKDLNIAGVLKLVSARIFRRR